MTHRSNLDILRAFAVCSVIVHHLVLTLHTHLGLGNESQRHYPVDLGHAGVLIFFVHTSLVLMYSLDRLRSTGKPVTVPFYIRRAFRIYPLAIAAILLALAFHIPSKTWDQPLPLTHNVILANLLLVQNIFTKQQVLGPLWSLPYEIQMYVVLPALFFLATRKRSPLYLGLLFAFFSLAGAVVATLTGHLNMAAYVPCFLAGVLCYALRHRIPARIPAALWIPFLISLFTVFLYVNRHEEEPTYWSGWILCLVLGLSINAFHDSKTGSVNRVAEKVALYSYGIYLLHVPALYLVFLYLHITGIPLAIALFLAATLLFSVAAFHAIESPFIDLGRRLSSPGRRETPFDPSMIAPAP